MGLASVIKGLIPEQLLPAALRIKKRIKSLKGYKKLSLTQYDALPALKGQLAYNRYGGYFLPESSLHRPAAQDVMNSGVFEPDTIDFMCANCGAGDIVHAGTYFGDFLPALSAACAADAKIWAYEPNDENFQCAQITTVINKLDNIVLENMGLGEKDGTLYIRTKDEFGRGLGGASYIVNESDYDAVLDQEIRLAAIDTIIPQDRNISIIQLDVEGHEQSVLAGALETIKRCKPVLILEIIPGCDLLSTGWFASNILSLGYEKQCELHVVNVVFSIP